MAFNTTNGYLYRNSGGVAVTSAATILVAIKQLEPQLEGTKYLISIRHPALTNGHDLFIVENQSGPSLSVNLGADEVGPMNTLQINEWNWLAIVGNDSNTVIAYLHDGEEWQTMSATQVPFNVDLLRIGSDSFTIPFKGKFAHIREWNRALTLANLTDEISSQTANPTGLVSAKSGSSGNLEAALAGQYGPSFLASGSVIVDTELPTLYVNRGLGIVPYLNELSAAVGQIPYIFVCAPVNRPIFDQDNYTLLYTAMQAWCLTNSRVATLDLGNVALIGDDLFHGNIDLTYHSPALAFETLLAGNGYAANFVGTNPWSNDAKPGDIPVSAQTGWTITNLTADIPNVVNRYPQTLFVTLGANNLAGASTGVTAYLNALNIAIGFPPNKRIFVMPPVNNGSLNLGQLNTLRTAMQNWCAGGPNRFYIETADAILLPTDFSGTRVNSSGAAKVAQTMYNQVVARVPPVVATPMAKRKFIDLNQAALTGSDFTSDAIHWSATGQQKIADLIFSRIDAAVRGANLPPPPNRGIGLAIGAATAAAVSKRIFNVKGTAAGIALANGVGLGLGNFAYGTASGLAIAMATGKRIGSGAGSAAGLATVTGRAGVRTGKGTSTAFATVLGVGVGVGSTWTPASDSGLVAWYDMSNPASYNTTTKTWTARFGSINAVAQSLGPTKITNGFDGAKNALSFTMTSDMSLIVSNPGIQEAMTVFSLKLITNTGFNQSLWVRGALGAGVATLLTFDYGGGLRSHYLGAADADHYEADLAAGGMVVSRHAKVARTVRWNGLQTATSTTVTSGTEPAATESFELIYYPGSSQNVTIQVAAIGIFAGSSWSDTLAQKIEGYIAHNNLGVGTSVLPAGHPYKTTAPT